MESVEVDMANLNNNAIKVDLMYNPCELTVPRFDDSATMLTTNVLTYEYIDVLVSPKDKCPNGENVGVYTVLVDTLIDPDGINLPPTSSMYTIYNYANGDENKIRLQYGSSSIG